MLTLYQCMFFNLEDSYNGTCSAESLPINASNTVGLSKTSYFYYHKDGEEFKIV